MVTKTKRQFSKSGGGGFLIIPTFNIISILEVKKYYFKKINKKV